ncbi:glycosyltransferase family 2 protein [Novosphingobium sp. TH158]|uniref:glycosyltransferase family 2 protein n=1 Tax=Novosphingobium sp. TH158 TaxID=2067455 RepID=UPI0013045882|nr:glycosyltransferase family 2 protein [Novosphingobium sp. TH158]
MPEPRKVSVALATYNGAKFLAAQLESYLVQSRLPDELVIGDDGSTDGTVALIEDFARRAPFPVRLTVNSGNLGPTRNFVETMLRCQGEVIFPSDQDDVWHAGKIERMLHFLGDRPGTWLAVHDAALVDGKGVPLGLTMAGQIRSAGEEPRWALVAGCCMAIDARLLELCRPVPRLGQHDAWLAGVAGGLGIRSYLDEALIDYRRHGANVSESFMSDLKPTSRLARWRERLGRACSEPAAPALERAVASREDLVRALHNKSAVLLQAVPASQLSDEISRQESQLERERARLSIHRAPILARPLRLLGAARSGAYSGRGGMLSLLRDIAALPKRSPADV